MRRIMTTVAVAAGLTLVPTFDAVHAQDEAATEEDDDDGNGELGLIGLVGLVGLAGLAGLKRRDRTDHRDTVAGTTPRR